MPPGRRSRPVPSRRSPVLILVVLSALVASCSSTIDGSAQAARVPGSTPPGITIPSTAGPSGSSAPGSSAPPSLSAPPSSAVSSPPVPGGLEKYYTQKLSWGSCADFASTDDDRQYVTAAGLDCARVQVPLEYDDPGGPSVQVAVLRSKATGPNKVGSLIMDPGGPGSPGTVSMAQMVSSGEIKVLSPYFDLIGFDPRGVGASRPLITCRTNAERDAERAANPRARTEADLAAQAAAMKLVVQHCIERTGKDEGIDGAKFLGTIGTREAAKDLDIVRAALGDSRLNYLGYSYGTQIGWVYAEQFPANVRTMVLDGALDPDQNPDDSLIEQGRGFQIAFQDFADWCAKQATCVLGSDSTKAVAVYQSLVRPLLDKPATLPDGRVLTFSDAITGTNQALYSDQLWTALAQGLLQLSTGDGSTMMALADFYDGRDASGNYGPLQDSFQSIICLDNPLSDNAAAEATAKEFLKVAPFQDPGDPLVSIVSWCNYWPDKATLEPHKPVVTGLPEVVVISTTHDPATPYEAGVQLAEDLGARLLTVEGTRHTAYLGAGIQCVDDLVTKYLVDLTLPPAGTKC